MKIREIPFPNLLVLEARAFSDSRGFFMETWRNSWYEELKIPQPFVQDNQAFSSDKGVVRGLHFQVPPHAQAKLVWVTRGAVFDVVVDLRVGSPTFGKSYGIELSASNLLRLYVPRGFAHGYATLEPGTEFQYKVDSYYNAQSEGGIKCDSPDLDIAWPDELDPILSEKDKELPLFSQMQSPFLYGRD